MTTCSTSNKKRWHLLDVLQLMGPGKSDNLLCGVKEPDFFLHLLDFLSTASYLGMCGKDVASMLDKDADEPEIIC